LDNHQKPWRAPAAHQTQLRHARHDVGLAAEEDARVVFLERGEARVGTGLPRPWCPGETARRDAEMGEPRLDRGERGAVELDTTQPAVVLERLHALGRLLRKVDELPVGVAR
jgi:hypothetical protein